MRFITLPDHDELPIHCPFCGKRVIDHASDPALDPCAHVVSAFHVEGVECEAVSSPRVEAGDDEDVLTQWESIELPGAFGFQLGQGVDTGHFLVFAP